MIGGNPIGRINGVGIIAFHYPRMVGGVDTVMPVKMVKIVIDDILEKADYKLMNSL